MLSPTTRPATDVLGSFRARLLEPITPRRREPLSEWSERNAHLSPENASEPGKWHAYPYQIGVMDAFTDPAVETVTFMKSARVGYTKILTHLIGYVIGQEPAPMLLVQPTIEDAKRFIKDEIEPMLRDTPALSGRVSPDRYRDKKNTQLRKTFDGGALTAVGANAPRSFRALTAKYVLFDEVDGYDPRGAGRNASKEGDQIALGRRRADTYRDRKIALGSTPRDKLTSRIAMSYAASDQRQFHVPCPRCRAMHVLKWEQFEWPNGQPELVRWKCPACGGLTDHTKKRWMVERGEWRASQPFAGHAGFHIWAAYSYAPAADWDRLAREYEEAKDNPQLLRVFVNTVLGEPFEDTGKRPDEQSLMARAVAEAWNGERPDGALIVTAGVDVQDDRLEAELVGWGAGCESWSIEYRAFPGDPGTGAVWADLERWLLDVRPVVTCVDSGGHHTQRVYEFCATREHRRVWPIKGTAGEGKPVWPRRTTMTKLKSKLFVIGVDSAKDSVYGWLRVSSPGAGYSHVPADRDASWFTGLTSEVVMVRYSRGFPVRVYERRKPAPGLPQVPNEPLDCRVYAYAALCSLGRISWEAIARRRDARAAEHAAEPPQPIPDDAVVPAPPAASSGRRRARGVGGWARNW